MLKNPFETLQSYQMYWIGENANVPRGEWLHCRDDAQAVECVQAKLGDEALEIWQGMRQVERLEPRCAVEDRVKLASRPMLKFAVLHGKCAPKLAPSHVRRPAKVKKRA